MNIVENYEKKETNIKYYKKYIGECLNIIQKNFNNNNGILEFLDDYVEIKDELKNELNNKIEEIKNVLDVQKIHNSIINDIKPNLEKYNNYILEICNLDKFIENDVNNKSKLKKNVSEIKTKIKQMHNFKFDPDNLLGLDKQNSYSHSISYNKDDESGYKSNNYNSSFYRNLSKIKNNNFNGKSKSNNLLNEKTNLEFLKTISFVIKKLLMKFDYILNNKNDLNNKENIEKYISECLNDIINELKVEIDNNKNNCNFKITNNDLIDLILNIFNQDENTMKIVKYIDDNFVSSVEEYIPEEKENDDTIEDEIFEGNKFKNFYFYINLFKILKEFTEKFISSFSIDKTNFILKINNYESRIKYIDNLVRTKKISKLSSKEIIYKYPNLKELCEFKTLTEELFNIKYKTVDYHNSIFNFIKTHKIGEKVNDKFYNWFGLGILVNYKYDFGNNNRLNQNSNWTNAYYGVGGKKTSSTEIINTLINKIKMGIGQTHKTDKLHSNNKRSKGRKIGNGVYLSPNIENVEQYCGIISVKNKKYKVALMVRVKMDKIREPEENCSIWLLDKDYVRPSRILLKRIE